MTRFELKPAYEQNQASFYGKAYIESENGRDVLYSYNTKILTRNNETGEIVRHWNGKKQNGKWSQTTGRHIFAFCGMKKADFLKLPIAE
jgi:hypothetical protein